MQTRMKLGLTVLAAAVAIGASLIIRAEYIGPSAHPSPQSVADVLQNPIDDQYVVLRGFLIKRVGAEEYIFSDGANEVRVEIDNEDFPAVKVDDKTKIEIHGEIEKDFLLSPEIDVESMNVTT